MTWPTMWPMTRLVTKLNDEAEELMWPMTRSVVEKERERERVCVCVSI